MVSGLTGEQGFDFNPTVSGNLLKGFEQGNEAIRFAFFFFLHKSRYTCKYKQQKLINVTQVFTKEYSL